jgi:addiction module HigA family antidote
MLRKRQLQTSKLLHKQTAMHNRAMPPIHPGETLKEMYLEPLGLTVTDLAANIGVTRRTVSLIVNGHSGISPEMAMRLSKSFNTTVEFWLNLQRSYDLWFASKKVEMSSIRNLLGDHLGNHAKNAR